MKQTVQITLASIVAITLMTTGIVYADDDAKDKLIAKLQNQLAGTIESYNQAVNSSNYFMAQAHHLNIELEGWKKIADKNQKQYVEVFNDRQVLRMNTNATISDLNDQLNKSKTQNSDLNNQISELNNQINELNKKLQSVQNSTVDTTALNEKITKLQDDKKSLIEKRDELKDDKQNLKQTIKELKAENSKLKDDKKELKQQNKKLTNENSKLENKIDRIQGHKQDKQNTINNMTGQMSEMNEKIESAANEATKRAKVLEFKNYRLNFTTYPSLSIEPNAFTLYHSFVVTINASTSLFTFNNGTVLEWTPKFVVGGPNCCHYTFYHESSWDVLEALGRDKNDPYKQRHLTNPIGDGWYLPGHPNAADMCTAEGLVITCKGVVNWKGFSVDHSRWQVEDDEDAFKELVLTAGDSSDSTEILRLNYTVVPYLRY